MPTGTAVLVAEFHLLSKHVVESPERTDIRLTDALAIQDMIRRSYPAFFHDSGEPERFPVRFELQFASGAMVATGVTPVLRGDMCDDHSRHVDRTRHAPVAPHWRTLVEPLQIEGHVNRSRAESGAPVWQHVIDERMISKVMVRVPDGMATAVTDGDWARLCFADQAGSARFP